MTQKLSDLADSKYPSMSGPDEMATRRIRHLHAKKVARNFILTSMTMLT